MRQFTVGRLIHFALVALAAGAVATTGPTSSAADASREPRYWAGDVSFVVQASYSEEVRLDEAPAKPTLADRSRADSRPATPAPFMAPQRLDTSEPADADRDATGLEHSPPIAEPQVVNQPRSPLAYSGNRFVRPTPTGLPRRMPVQPLASPSNVPRGKSFETALNRPTVSPYLNLFREDVDSQALPDYYAYVRPQLEQQEAARRQQQDLEQLERRVQGGQSNGSTAPPSGGDPTARTLPARFMNTAQFYSGWQR